MVRLYKKAISLIYIHEFQSLRLWCIKLGFLVSLLLLVSFKGGAESLSSRLWCRTSILPGVAWILASSYGPRGLCKWQMTYR